MPVSRRLGGTGMDRHPKPLTSPWHRAAQQQEQGQRCRQQPHPRCPPQLCQGCFIASPSPQGGFHNPPLGLGRAGGRGKGAVPRLNFPALSSPCCTWPPPKKAEKAVATSSNVLCLVPPMPPTPNPWHAIRREAMDSDRGLPPLLGLLGRAQKGQPVHGYGMGEAGSREGHF